MSKSKQKAQQQAAQQKAGQQKPAPQGAGQGAPPDTMPPERAKAYWRKNVIIIAILLSIWAIVSYGMAIFAANALLGVPVGSLPMSFWFAQQGAIITFVGLIFFYCWYMDRVDKEFGVNE